MTGRMTCPQARVSASQYGYIIIELLAIRSIQAVGEKTNELGGI
jgi:hypothetical protein